MRFAKYHGLGNDYLVIEERDLPSGFGPQTVRLICNRHFGVGSDGILLRGQDAPDGVFRLRILNPDGSEAEKSGNGLRIFARYLWDQRVVTTDPFVVVTFGGKVCCRVHPGGGTVTVDMGRASFSSEKIPVAGPAREVLRESLSIHGQHLEYSAVTMGNPHCVVICEQATEAEVRRSGPAIETHPNFLNRTNVQFVHVRDMENIDIQIWERGAGYTLASGSSSCAAAAVCRRLGLCSSHVQVHMPGGTLQIEISDTFDVRMTGPVTKVAEGVIASEMLQQSAGNP